MAETETQRERVLAAMRRMAEAMKPLLAAMRRMLVRVAVALRKLVVVLERMRRRELARRRVNQIRIKKGRMSHVRGAPGSPAR